MIDMHGTKTLVVREFQEIKTKDGNEDTYLGMSLIIENGEIKIKMDYYIQNVLKDWDNIREYVQPADGKLFYSDDNSRELESKDKLHRAVAQLLYLSKRALHVHYLCTRVQNSIEEDEKKLIRILGYLKCTISLPRVGFCTLVQR